MQKQHMEKLKRITDSITSLLDKNDGINKRFLIFLIQRLLFMLIEIMNDSSIDDNKWIDASIPPIEDGSYLVCTKKKSVCTARFYTSSNKFSSRLNESIVAWMPLPDPLSTIDNRKEYK